MVQPTAFKGKTPLTGSIVPPPPQGGDAPTTGVLRNGLRYRDEITTGGSFDELPNGHERETSTTCVRTFYKNNVPIKAERTLTVNTEKVTTEIVYFPTDEPEPQQEHVMHDVSMASVDGGDANANAMVISRPPSPVPPISLFDRDEVDRFLRRMAGEEFCKRTRAEIFERIAMTVAAEKAAEMASPTAAGVLTSNVGHPASNSRVGCAGSHVAHSPATSSTTRASALLNAACAAVAMSRFGGAASAPSTACTAPLSTSAAATVLSTARAVPIPAVMGAATISALSGIRPDSNIANIAPGPELAAPNVPEAAVSATVGSAVVGAAVGAAIPFVAGTAIPNIVSAVRAPYSDPPPPYPFTTHPFVGRIGRSATTSHVARSGPSSTRRGNTRLAEAPTSSTRTRSSAHARTSSCASRACANNRHIHVISVDDVSNANGSASRTQEPHPIDIITIED